MSQLPATARMGTVHLSVADLGRSIAFYEGAIGLSVRDHRDGRAFLGAGAADLLALTEVPGARPAHGYCGLFHFALLVPDRAALAGWLRHAADTGVRLTGMADHFVSEALYLTDPDGHGIEIYADRPREEWEGQVGRMTTLPLNTGSLLAVLDADAAPFDGLPDGTTMGHVHLRVSAIPPSTLFYRDVIGFDLMAAFGQQAVFLSAGGYHHHIGANSWESAGAPPAPEGLARLEAATMVLPDAAALAELAGRLEAAKMDMAAGSDSVRVLDPSGNQLAFEVAELTG